MMKNTLYTPRIFSAEYAIDVQALQSVLQNPHITKFDTLEQQLRELMQCRHPTQRLPAAELDALAAEHRGGVPLSEYGVWVYYPWSQRVVHLLPAAEFAEVRTNRNRNKITAAEQQRLSTKRVGIIGLSVGQSVALAMALERSAGELRLADFDTLDLSNLNRLRTGVQHIGLPKTVIAAREIAEIDPFLRVTCFEEGITPDNIEAFLLEGGKLDVLVEESDGLLIKFLARYRAREHGIPVVMETNDRCMVDVERFDVEPQRAILHGLVEEYSMETLQQLTPMERLQLVIQIVGENTISPILLNSVHEIGKTLVGIPQLASQVVAGGGITADVVRRILLDQYSESGRYWVDVEAVVGGKG
jgi:molybdopterin/thiamine biosynthesis adenylyltransferase